VIGSPGFPRDEDDMRERAARSYDRCFLPSGQGRQFAAVLCSPNRVAALRQLALPALVIHGSDDPLVPVAGGRETAESIPAAEWLCIDGMGHDLPKELQPKLADAISALTARADGV
jgi:pimeloyl-ACP methyl ester carboxylesterase